MCFQCMVWICPEARNEALLGVTLYWNNTQGHRPAGKRWCLCWEPSPDSACVQSVCHASLPSAAAPPLPQSALLFPHLRWSQGLPSERLQGPWPSRQRVCWPFPSLSEQCPKHNRESFIPIIIHVDYIYFLHHHPKKHAHIQILLLKLARWGRAEAIKSSSRSDCLKRPTLSQTRHDAWTRH